MRRWTLPGTGSISRPSGMPSRLSSSSASSPITTTMRGCTMAISSSTRARHSGADRSLSPTGHLTKTVPYTASGSMPRRLKLFMSALPARP